MMDIGVEEGYMPTELVEGGEDAICPPTPRQGSRDPNRVPSLLELLVRPIHSAGVNEHQSRICRGGHRGEF
eukprot:5708246-Amphidinium_carterae.1